MPKKINSYWRLRRRMQDLGITHDDLAAELGLTRPAISARLCAKVDWELKQVYTVARLLDIPEEEIYLYFPADGRDLPSEKKQGNPQKALAEDLAALLAAYFPLPEGVLNGAN